MPAIIISLVAARSAAGRIADPFDDGLMKLHSFPFLEEARQHLHRTCMCVCVCVCVCVVTCMYMSICMCTHTYVPAYHTCATGAAPGAQLPCPGHHAPHPNPNPNPNPTMTLTLTLTQAPPPELNFLTAANAMAEDVVVLPDVCKVR